MLKYVLAFVSLLLLASTARAFSPEYYSKSEFRGARYTHTSEGTYQIGSFKPVSYRWITNALQCAVILCLGSKQIKTHAKSPKN
jgi:hypothetical protein